MAAMRDSRIPGAALGILAGDREEHATFGVASLSSLRPVTPATLFQIGSLTKTYTATAIWRLIDEGALALDAPVRTYLPDLALNEYEQKTGWHSTTPYASTTARFYGPITDSILFPNLVLVPGGSVAAHLVGARRTAAMVVGLPPDAFVDNEIATTPTIGTFVTGAEQ